MKMAQDFLTDLVPKELHNLKPDKLLYFGLGRDVWLPFGIIDAKHVIAWDRVDKDYIPVGIGATFRQKFYGYGIFLLQDLYSMGATPDPIDWREEESTFIIKFMWKNTERSLTVLIQEVDQVHTFPKADGILFAATMKKGDTEQRAIQESGATFWIQWDSDAEGAVKVWYPSSLNTFENKWNLTTALAATQKSCAKQIWSAFKSLFQDESGDGLKVYYDKSTPLPDTSDSPSRSSTKKKRTQPESLAVETKRQRGRTLRSSKK